jgi:nucleoside-diphosphate-sugar epimerase
MGTGPQRLLVIGSRGFTGRHLLARLRDNQAFIVAEAAEHGLDLRRPDTIARALDATEPQTVLNLGAISTAVTEDVSSLYEVNAFGQLNLLQCLAERGFAGRLVFASSASVYGGGVGGVIAEDQPLAPVSHYAFSKQLAENFCRLFADRFDIVIVRPFNCTGVGQREIFVVPKIVRHFRDRAAAIELGNLEIERDFIDIRDAVHAYELILTAARPASPVHIASGKTASIRDIIRTLEELTGHRMELRVDPALVRANDVHRQQADITRLQTLGFVPRFSLRDTLGWMLGFSRT